MTAGEFLKLLQDNPDKELRFERFFDSSDNNVFYSVGYRSQQKLGGVTAKVDDKVIKITLDSYI